MINYGDIPIHAGGIHGEVDVRDCFVVGCGRSGTSMTAEVLAAAGYHPGHSLIPADAGNPQGYYEDVEVNAINDELLAPHVAIEDGHGSLRRPPAGGERWLAALPLELEVTPSLDHEIRMTAAVQGPVPRCRKDPQFCYTLPAWRMLLPRAVCVCVFREPSRTANSLVTHMRHTGLGFGYSEALRLWLASYRHILERHSQAGTWIFCHYQQILDGSALPRLERLLDARLPREVATPELRRSPVAHDLPGDVTAVYANLCERAGYTDPNLAILS